MAPDGPAPLPAAISERLDRLAPDQRAAAVAPPGPVLCVAPAGSGKTTTLVARVAWLLANGADPGTVTVVAFNRRAAEELTDRLAAAVEPLGLGRDAVRVRTFHALGREVLAEDGVDVTALVDRDERLAALFPAASAADRGRLDLAFARLKLDLGVTADDVAADPEPGPIARAFVAYERSLAEDGSLDFDDLVARALRRLEASPGLLARWRARCRDLLVDEAQDLDRSQLRLALLLAAPANRVFLVGDDDQTIYGWRLADVRRVLGLAGELPGLRRVDLVTNYRCPRPVVERAVRLVEHNEERFAKRILARPGAAGRLVLAPDPSDDVVRVDRLLGSWPSDTTGRAVLARTNRELLPAVVAAVARGIPFRPPDLDLPVEDERLDGLLERAATTEAAATEAVLPGGAPARLLLALGRLREAVRTEGDAAAGAHVTDARPAPEALVAALLAWAPGFADVAALAAAVRRHRDRLAALRRDDAALALATAHGTKGLEWDHVAVLADGFPGRRAVSEAAEPARVLEEERRLAYVAWTRARRSLTLLYDPAAVSPFLLEAFEAEELGLGPGGRPDA